MFKGPQSNFISAAIINGGNKGERLFISRINLEPSESWLPFTVRHRQFSAIWAFAMTISKSSRQSSGCVVLAFIFSSVVLDLACLFMICLHEEGLGKMLRFAITIHTIKETFCQIYTYAKCNERVIE